jgi:hypothetical protein
MFVGPETSINAATSVKVTTGGAYSFDTVAKWTTKAQDVKTAVKETQIATDLKRTIGQEISTFALGVTQTVGGNWDLSCSDYSVNTIAAKIDGMDVNIKALVDLRLKGLDVAINADGQLKMAGPGRVAINGGIVQIG